MSDSTLKVLLIDDDADDYIITRELLAEAEGSAFVLEWVATYSEGLTAIQNPQYDICLVDYRLGEATGIELLSEAIKGGSTTPIILLTGQGHQEVDIAAMQAGAADYLVKGQITAPLLERSIRHALERKRAAQALRESETRFRTVVESLGEGLLITDLDDVILYANTRMTEMTGYSEKELLGQPAYKLFLPPEQWASLQQRNVRRSEGIGEQYEVLMTTREGRRLWVLVNATPFRDTSGAIIGTLGAITDISEHKKSQQEITSLITSARCLFWHSIIEERNGEFLWNIEIPYPEAAQRFLPLEMSPQDTYEDAWYRCKLPEDAGHMYRNASEALSSGKTGYQQEIRCHIADGSIRWLNEDVRIEPLGAGRWQAIGVCTDISERKRAEAALQESERRHRFLAETTTDALYQRYYESSSYEYLSPAITLLTGYTPEEINQIGFRSIIEKIEGDIDSLVVDTALRQQIIENGEFRADYLIRTKSGEVRWLSDHSVSWQDEKTQRVGWVGVLSDITARKLAEERQRTTAAGLQAVLEAADELLECDDLDSLLRGAVEIVREKLGVERCGITLVDEETGELIGTYGTDLHRCTTDERLHRMPEPEDWSSLVQPWRPGQPHWMLFTDREFSEWDGRWHQPTGKRGWIIATPIQSTRGAVGVLFNDTAISGELYDEVKQEMVAVFCSLLGNMIERKRAEQKLERNAFYDTLTGLPNRSLFMDRLQRAIARTKRHQNYRFAVLFIDLDRFKNVNDSLGHIIGDELLVAAAQRLSGCLRGDDTVARLGGDEFTILLDDIEDVSETVHVAERIQRELSLPFIIDSPGGGKIEWFTTASIGIALSTSGYERAEEILRDADIAMYRAKASGKAHHELFDISMHEKARTLLQLESDLWRALEREEFLLHYQPIVSLATEALVGFEALIRWQHPERGLVSPGEFIPVIEDTGLIVPVGQWVLREACRQMRSWQTQLAGAKDLTISVNVSSRQFSQPKLVDEIHSILQETKLDARCLKLEITESVIMQNADSAAAMLARLKSLGIQVSIDDFGTGYSSLSSLHLFPLDYLKIDRSFVDRMGAQGDNEIIQTIVSLARNLELEVIAEGIETQEQLAQLGALKCEYGQGYFFSRPLTHEAATAFMTGATQDKNRGQFRSHQQPAIVNGNGKSIVEGKEVHLSTD